MEDFLHCSGTYPCKRKHAIIKLKDGTKLLVESFHCRLFHHCPHAISGELVWGSPRMEEGLPQSKPHHFGGWVDRENASFHLGEDNMLVKYKFVNNRGERHIARVFRHYAWYLNSLSTYKHFQMLLIRHHFSSNSFTDKRFLFLFALYRLVWYLATQEIFCHLQVSHASQISVPLPQEWLCSLQL